VFAAVVLAEVDSTAALRSYRAAGAPSPVAGARSAPEATLSAAHGAARDSTPAPGCSDEVMPFSCHVESRSSQQLGTAMHAHTGPAERACASCGDPNTRFGATKGGDMPGDTARRNTEWSIFLCRRCALSQQPGTMSLTSLAKRCRVCIKRPSYGPAGGVSLSSRESSRAAPPRRAISRVRGRGAGAGAARHCAAHRAEGEVDLANRGKACEVEGCRVLARYRRKGGREPGAVRRFCRVHAAGPESSERVRERGRQAAAGRGPAKGGADVHKGPGSGGVFPSLMCQHPEGCTRRRGPGERQRSAGGAWVALCRWHQKTPGAAQAAPAASPASD
jgi:hypothetical protein